MHFIVLFDNFICGIIVLLFKMYIELFETKMYNYYTEIYKY